MNSGIEHAALMISEEKTQHDSRKNNLKTTFFNIQIHIKCFAVVYQSFIVIFCFGKIKILIYYYLFSLFYSHVEWMVVF